MKNHKQNRWLSLRERFDIQHEEVSVSGCWIWTGTCSHSGYGQIKENYRTRLAHRVSWEIHNGAIPEGIVVCHRCDVPQCVNPAHLFLGTMKDNVADMLSKGRGSDRKGDKHPNSKISNSEILEIIRLHKAGHMGKEIASRFGISRGYVSQLINGKRRNANQRGAERGYGSAA